MWVKAKCGLLALAIPLAALGQTQNALTLLRKTNPNELTAAATVSRDCVGLSDAEALEAVNGVLVRSRIKPLDPGSDHGHKPLMLMINVGCLENHTAFVIYADFVGTAEGEPIRAGLFGYSTFGTYGGRKDFLLNEIKESTEKAITDYLKANFDLGK